MQIFLTRVRFGCTTSTVKTKEVIAEHAAEVAIKESRIRRDQADIFRRGAVDGIQAFKQELVAQVVNIKFAFEMGDTVGTVLVEGRVRVLLADLKKEG